MKISVKDLTVAYQGKTVLNHVSTVIQAPKFTGSLTEWRWEIYFYESFIRISS